MKIGLISDTHDNIYNIDKALKIFRENNIELIIHAGDFVAPFAVKKLLSSNIKFVGVYGNNDGEKEGIEQIFKDFNSEIFADPYSLVLNNKKISITHNLKKNLNGLKEHYDIVIFGHTHKQEAYKLKQTLFINLGEACGWVSGNASVGILDLNSMEYDFLDII